MTAKKKAAGDPVLPAIRTHRKANLLYRLATDEVAHVVKPSRHGTAAQYAAMDREFAAAEKLVNTVPTTLAGVRRLLGHVEEIGDELCEDHARQAISSAYLALCGLAHGESDAADQRPSTVARPLQ